MHACFCLLGVTQKTYRKAAGAHHQRMPPQPQKGTAIWLSNALLSAVGSARTAEPQPLTRALTCSCSDWAACKGWGTLTNMYRRTWNALYPICPGCLLLAEGGGQAAGCECSTKN